MDYSVCQPPIEKAAGSVYCFEAVLAQVRTSHARICRRGKQSKHTKERTFRRTTLKLATRKIPPVCEFYYSELNLKSPLTRNRWK